MPLLEEHEAALARLMATGELTAAQVTAVRREFSALPTAKGRTGWLVEVGGYAGGGLMIAGVAMYLSFAWSDLAQAAKLLILFASMAVLVLAAFVIAGGPAIRRTTGARGRAAGSLLAMSAIPAAVAAVVIAPDHEAAWGFSAGLAVGVMWLAVRSNALGIVIAAMMTGGAVGTIGDVLGLETLGIGLILLAAGAAWTGASLAGLLRPRVLSLAAGITLSLIGAQLPMYQEGAKVWSYALTLAVAAICFALYRWDRSIVVVAGGVIGLTIAVPEIAYDATDGRLNPGLILLIGGAVLVASSILGLRLHRSTSHGLTAPGVQE